MLELTFKVADYSINVADYTEYLAECKKHEKIADPGFTALPVELKILYGIGEQELEEEMIEIYGDEARRFPEEFIDEYSELLWDTAELAYKYDDYSTLARAFFAVCERFDVKDAASWLENELKKFREAA